MVFWMAKAARSIKAQLHDSIDAATAPGDRRGLALVGMAFLAVGREGLESVFFLIATLQQTLMVMHGMADLVDRLLDGLAELGVAMRPYLDA